MNIGIFGGSFDPVHLGHVQQAEAVIKQLNLDKLILIPTKNNPWKDQVYTRAEDRINMLNIAFRNLANIEISSLELDSKDQKNYTIDTIKTLKKIYPNDQLFYLMGMDQCSKFHLWKDADQIAELVQLVTFDRPPFIQNKNLTLFKFQKVKVFGVNYSSTAIREGDFSGLDREVLKYISNNGLYLETVIDKYMSKSRYLHSCSVAKTAVQIAEANGLNKKKAYIAGMLHDIAKEMDHSQAKALMKEYFPQHLHAPEPIWHQWLSAYIAKKTFLITDPEILQAITNHTTGSTNMSLLDMVIYCADKYEPLRPYDTKKAFALCKKDIRKGFAQSLKDFYEFAKNNNKKIDPIFYQVYKKYGDNKIDE